MLKYTDYDIVGQEIPDEMTLAVNISGCPCHCPGCHSSYLAGDVGEPLDEAAIDSLLSRYGAAITWFAFMGGDGEPSRVDSLAAYLRSAHPSLAVAWYTGRPEISPAVDVRHFDYIKVGPYIEALGGLKSPTTNQRLYHLKHTPEGTEYEILMPVNLKQ